MHDTSVPDILKVLNPLFLDDLRAQLDAAGGNARMLLNLRTHMARIRAFDPACGSGNFLAASSRLDSIKIAGHSTLASHRDWGLQLIRLPPNKRKRKPRHLIP